VEAFQCHSSLILETHIRFRVVVPLLLVAELVVHQRLIPIARAFLERNLIPPAATQRFDAALVSAFRLRNSVVAEVILLVVVYVVGILIAWRRHTALDVSTWYVAPSSQGLQLSLAGVWYAFVSLPIFQFLLLRCGLADAGLTRSAPAPGLPGCRLILRSLSRPIGLFAPGWCCREFPNRCVERDCQCRVTTCERVPMKLETLAPSLERQLQTLGRNREDVSATADRQLSLQGLLE
jgi:hypothetical protein